MGQVVIEFRSGTYFQSLASNNGGPMATAQRFDSAENADALMRAYPWIMGNGGMAVPFDPVRGISTADLCAAILDRADAIPCMREAIRSSRQRNKAGIVSVGSATLVEGVASYGDEDA